MYLKYIISFVAIASLTMMPLQVLGQEAESNLIVKLKEGKEGLKNRKEKTKLQKMSLLTNEVKLTQNISNNWLDDDTKEMVVSTKNLQKTMQNLKANPQVEYVEIDKIQKPTNIVADPILQWHIGSVMAPKAWETTTGNGVLVAVCDTGIDNSHPDLKNNIRADLGFDIARNSPFGWNSIQNPHGTMVAGIIASSKNGVGTMGMAYNSQIIPLKISLDASGGAYTSHISQCIRHAADKGAKVINVSFSGIESFSVQSASRYANSKDATVVYAAGNTGTNLNFGNSPYIIAVGGINKNNQRSNSSSFGNFVDVVAPSVEIATTFPNSGYVMANGTSFSTPIVAGLVAVTKSKYPNLKPSQILAKITQNATDLGTTGYDTQFGHGKVNFEKTVQ